MSRTLPIALAVALGLAGPAQATPIEDLGREAERLARDAAEQIISTLRVIMMSLPQYEAPEVLDNGDIIIRRRTPRAETPSPVPRALPDGGDETRGGATET